MSIIPGIENFAPERTLTSSGSFASPSVRPIFFSSFVTCFADLVGQPAGPAAVHVRTARIGGDGEPGRHRQPQHRGHLGEVGALAPQQILHVHGGTTVLVVKGEHVGHTPSLVAVGFRPVPVGVARRSSSHNAPAMPSGVGAPLRAARIVIAASLAAASIAILATPAHAQAAPPTGGIVINKIEIGGTAPATFEVTGPGITGTATLLANVVAENTPTPALPALPLLIPGTYTITETAPVDENGQSVWELTSVVCDGEEIPVQGNSVQVVVADAVISCTFTDTVTRSEILGLKVVSGDTSTWTRPGVIPHHLPRLRARHRHRAARRSRWTRHVRHRSGHHPAGDMHDQRDRHRQ